MLNILMVSGLKMMLKLMIRCWELAIKFVMVEPRRWHYLCNDITKNLSPTRIAIQILSD